MIEEAIVIIGILVFLVSLKLLSGSDVGGVSGGKLSKHITSSFPEGFYTHYDKRIFTTWSWLYALVTLTFLWAAVNIEGMFQTAIIYATFGILAMVIAFVEIVAPKKSFPSAACGLCGYKINVSKLIIMGFAIGLIFIPMNFFFGFRINQLVVKESILSIITIGWMIPIIEEGIFNGTVGASSIESYGVFYGSLTIIILWILFHALTFWPITLSDVLFLGLFRIASIIPLVKYKSMLPGLIGHWMVNISSILVMFLSI